MKAPKTGGKAGIEPPVPARVQPNPVPTRPSRRGRLGSPMPPPRLELRWLAVVAALSTVARLDVSRADDAAPAGAVVADARALARADFAAIGERRLEAYLAEHPTDREATLALGDIERQRCRLDRAAETYRRLLARDPTDARALAGLAEMYVLAGRPLEALSTAEDALLLSRPGEEPARAFRAKALALVELRRYDLAIAAAERAVAAAPTDPRCSEALAAASYRAGRMDWAGKAYLRATELDPLAEEAHLRLGNGFGPRSNEKPWREGPDTTAFTAAVASWNAGDLEGAQVRFLALVRTRADVYKYHLGLGLARLSIRRRNEARLGGDGPTLYLTIPAPEIEGLPSIVPGYDLLGPIEKHVVCVATAPARALFPAIRASGVLHDLMTLDDDVTDAAARRDLVGKRTFDGRWYEQLRAVAGTHGATGAEKLREAAEFGFNTFAHEFGHQVHRMGLDAAKQQEVDRLYAAAVAANACLDWYAASNADEYFAQGYEAFLSPVKRGCLTETARHTRDELRGKDPALFAFLTSMLDVTYESPAVFAAIEAAASRESPIVDTPGKAAEPEPEPAGR